MKRWLALCVFCLIGLLLLAACAPVAPDPNAPQPSNPGKTGEALKLKGDPASGEKIFAAKCQECHGEEGKGGVINEGTEDGTVPTLNPIEDEFKNDDLKVYAANLDVFIEHGSTPEGDSPTRIMLPYGDSKILQPQEIADVIAYIISLNQ